ncbi:hypothetical protein [uncultured Flavonifractor sp.]|uniref:hypothetical protein n=1 Tax=uncultured Flavonifractor sp. TaxID=1193534 RepID=UPI00259651D3|nr:hypothetical protein [uncultured Flavonifractor sp.]
MSNIVECRVIRPKDRESAVRATVEILLDSGIRLANMHLLKPREGRDRDRLTMPCVKTKTGAVIPAYSPTIQETRQAMLAAAEETLAEAERAGTNDYTKVYLEMGPESRRVPQFTNLQMHKFPENDNPVRAVFSVMLDKEFSLNRIVVVKDPETQMLAVRLPRFQFLNGHRTMQYFRLPADDFETVYAMAMEKYLEREKETA